MGSPAQRAAGGGSMVIVVRSDDAGERLDALLACRPEIATRTAAQRLLEAGSVLVDGRARRKGHRVVAGERVTVALDEARERQAGDRSVALSAPHAVAFEDDHIIVVDKPAGVTVHPGHGQATGTLAQALADRAEGGPPERAGIVHRLDRDTSGLLVVAKSDRVHRALSDALRRREVRRGYLALVEGVPDARTATIDAPLGRARADRTARSTSTDRPRPARTHFELLEPLGLTALLSVRLETGRTHQIRAHLAAIDHPVCGDRRYGGARSGARLGLRRQFLHAARLGLGHPVTGETLELESALPEDLAAALALARAEPAPVR